MRRAMGLRRAAVTLFLKGALGAICRIDSREYKAALEANEPMLVAFNHVNFLDAPILVASGYPRRVTGIAKAETWANPFLAFLFDSYGAIPIERGRAFAGAFESARAAIAGGSFVCVAPEGTRSSDGVLGRGKPGIIQLAIESGAPILPVALEGGENIWKNMRRLRRTRLAFRAGKPFRIKGDGKPGREERELITSEVMGQIARLMPEGKRGIYAQAAQDECRHLEFV